MTPIQARPARRSGPTIVIVIGVALLGLGVWAFATGLRSTVKTVTDSLDTAIDPTGDLVAATGIPGSASAELSPGTYQVIAVGQNLTRTELDPGGIVQNNVIEIPFTAPDFMVAGPNPSTTPLAMGNPTVMQLSDTPSGDSVSIGEFEVDVGGTYTLTTTGEEIAVRLVGIDQRPDIAADIRNGFSQTLKLVLGAMAASFGFIVLIGGAIWFGSRRNPGGGQGGTGQHVVV